MDWGGGAGQNIAPILEEIGRAQANRTANQGQILGRSLADIGGLIASAPQRQMQQQELQARTAELQGLAQDRQAKAQQMAQAQQNQARVQALLQDPTLRDEQGQLDLGKFAAAVTPIDRQMGDAAAQTAERLSSSRKTDAELADKQRQLDEAHRDRIALALGDAKTPEDVQVGLAALHNVVPDAMLQQVAGAFDQSGIDGGRAFVQRQSKGYLERQQKAADAAAAPFTLTKGATRIVNGEPVASNPEPAPAPPRPVEVHTVDDKGRSVTRFLPPDQVSGQTFTAPPTAAERAPANAEELTPDAVDLAGAQYRLLGNAGLPTRLGEAARTKIMNAGAAQSKALGQTPVEAIQKQAALKADSASLRKMQGMADAASGFETKALGQADIIRDLSSKVDRTQFPLINAALQAGRTEITGNTNATQLANAIETFTEEYAKIMNGSTGSSAASSDSVRAASKRLINAAMSKGTMGDVLNLMQREMDLTQKGYGATIAHINDRIGGNGSTPAVPPPTGRFNPATGKVE